MGKACGQTRWILAWKHPEQCQEHSGFFLPLFLCTNQSCQPDPIPVVRGEPHRGSGWLTAHRVPQLLGRVFCKTSPTHRRLRHPLGHCDAAGRGWGWIWHKDKLSAVQSSELSAIG